MLRIGEFSKLSLLTIKALRFYEKEEILIPATVDKWNGHRYYESYQLQDAARIKSYRQLGLSIWEIKSILAGAQVRDIMLAKAAELEKQQSDINFRLSIIRNILEDNEMKYQAVIKEIPECIVYYEEVILAKYADAMTFIPASGAECKRINPALKCSAPAYEFVEYLDNEHRERNVRIRHNEAVTEFGNENERIKFRKVSACKVISIMHKGSYDALGKAYAYIYKYAEENGYEPNGLSRECYIDGIWNKESVEEWLTEIQLPIK